MLLATLQVGGCCQPDRTPNPVQRKGSRVAHTQAVARHEQRWNEDISGPPLLQPGLLGVATPHSSLTRGDNIARRDRHPGAVIYFRNQNIARSAKPSCTLWVEVACAWGADVRF